MIDNTINGRTHEEIKRGLELCCVGKCSECPYREECDEHLACGGDMLPADVVLTDITALINQLERERDALLDIVKKDGICRYCKHNDLCTKQFPYCAECEKTDCVCYTCENICNWQWCGVPQEVKPDEQIQT